MSTLTVPAVIANPEQPERRVEVDFLVDTGATYSLLPGEIVAHLGLATPWQRTGTLASGEDVTYPMGQVSMRLNGEEMSTLFLAGPRGCQGLIGAVTLEQFALAVDPVSQRLVPTARIFI